MQYLKQYGAQLIALGYKIVPLPPGTKGPRRPGWQRMEATAEMVETWTANGSANDGIGILASGNPAIDVDVRDPEIAAEMHVIIEQLFGPVPHIRVGQAPKFLIPFQCSAPFKKVASSVYYDPITDTEHHVEVLADGQQWVAYHQHPDTLLPYEWTRGGLLDAPSDQLPELTAESAWRLVIAFEALAERYVDAGRWEVRTKAPKEAPTPTDDPLLDWKPTIDFKTLKSALAKIPNSGVHELDYDAWRNVIFAIHRETNGADHGLRLAHAWSERSAKHDPQFLDERVWPYINSQRPGAVTGLTILKMARELGWKAPEPARAEESEDPYPQYEWGAYSRDFADVDWLIKGVLPHAQFGVLYGASGSGKTFFALDLAAAVAAGEPWRGLKTRQGTVVYIAAEAAGGVKKRLAAYDMTHVAGARPRIMPAAPNLLSSDDADSLIKSTNLRGGAALIVVDTMAASHTGDENSAQDMGLFVALCKRVSLETGAMVLAVHHTGKDESKGARGSSSIFAAADVVISISEADRAHVARVSKQKDGEKDQEYGFKLRVVDVGEDQDGEPITSCVVDEIQVVPTPKRKRPLSDAQLFILETFDKAIGMSESMTETELVEAVKAAQKEYGEVPQKASNIIRSIARLAEFGAINCEMGNILRA